MFPFKPMHGQSFDDGAQIARGQKAGDPFAFGARVIVDYATKFERETGLAGPGPPDQRVDQDIGVVTEPGVELGKDVLAPNQRQFAGLGNEQVEFARLFAVARPATPVGGRELLAPQWQADAGVAEDEPDRVEVAGNNHAPAYVAGADRPIAHFSPLLSRQKA